MADEILDISPVISSRLGVFPGDQPYVRTVSMSFARGDHLELSRIQTTVHLGAHADAPCHYAAQGAGIGERPLRPYLGRAQVITANGPPGGRVGLTHLATQNIQAPRVLLRTGSFADPDHWNADFCGLEPSLIDWLADRGVCLIGIDTPSIDPEASKNLETHARVFARDLAILEGLDLRTAVDGFYALIALPLRLEGADASPVRAVLLPASALGGQAPW